ncbi:metallo-beta-lactamase domain-containing protein 2 isoform X2 [Leucoraja erinacea]|uniref:metallo-beta-lactamase domain-containing protein 2 isoform X2 n=1 Tax=Leucoraja erinaceus TaxID=7782 RepID=UPI0024585F8F|nr:metallo-beta-lactamase domain-containing protein 2 isoform X2 [Leucoraja erinacea]
MMAEPGAEPDPDTTGEWFWHQRVSPGLYLIRERFFEAAKRANIWLLQGSQRDLVVDSGLGLVNLHGFLRARGLIGSKPVLVVATHVHFDHSGGLHHFDRVAVHRAEASALVHGDNYETVTWLSDAEISKAPQPGWKADTYRVKPVHPSRVLDEDSLKLCQVGWGASMHSYFQVPPEMFDRVQARPVAGPLKDILRLVTKPLLRCLACVLRVVVLLEGEPPPQSEVQNALEQDFIKDLPVLCSVHLSLNPD